MAALLLGLPCLARADAAARLLERGIEQYAMARFRAAKETLEAAAHKATRPATRARARLYLGLTHAVLGDEQRARSVLRQALLEAPELTLDPEQFSKEQLALVQSVRANLVATLKVEASEGGGEVWVGGKPRGAAPVTLRLLPGVHQVQLRLPDGRRTTPSRVRLRAGETSRLVLQPPPRPRPPATRPRPTASVVEPPPPATTPGRLWTWIAAGSAVAALGTGLAVGLWSRSDYDSWNDSCPTAHDQPRCVDLEQSVKDKDLAANILFGVGGALAITAVVLYLLEPGRSAEEPRLGGLRLGPGGLSATLRF